MDKVFIIAEAGVNHNGDIRLAKELIDKARESGADAVKFQTFISEDDVAGDTAKAEYQQSENTGESQLQMLKRLELGYEDFRELKAYCQKVGILFLSSPFEEKSIAFLESINMPIFKVASSEVTNYPFLRAIGKLKKPVILSTGMSDLGEVEAAIRVLEEYGSGPISLLHCNTEYPTPAEDVNLRAMLTLGQAFAKEVGYSDHTVGIEIAIAAVAMGAKIIEKHFTLDKDLPGPDHQASLNPVELKAMVEAIRRVEKALGSGVKMPSSSERKNIAVARKGIVAAKAIAKGEQLTEDNLIAKRAGGGISPMRWQEIIGRTAMRDFAMDEKIEI
ncbi:N-acetylneuraminate synthase [Clostridiales bacterium COT073_COT-073]|nr:N-acetylneuraminate synthase [Clostridiales bacterium COT073_COT-073]